MNPCSMRMAKSSTCRGFTLLELSIVLLIIGVIVGGGAVLFAQSVQQKQIDGTQARLAVLQKALLDFRTVFNRLPCPADAELDPVATGNNLFGREAVTLSGGNPTGCNNTAGGPPKTNFVSGNYFQGLVPTNTLNLPDEYAFDGWGQRIMYTVDQRFTVTDAFTSITITDTTTRMTINATMTGPVQNTDRAAYVLLSYGANGHGAFPRHVTFDTGIPIRINVGSTNTDELKNCHCGSDGLSGAFDSTFVQQPATTADNTDFTKTFDDIVVYATRKDLRTATE